MALPNQSDKKLIADIKTELTRIIIEEKATINEGMLVKQALMKALDQAQYNQKTIRTRPMEWTDLPLTRRTRIRNWLAYKIFKREKIRRFRWYHLLFGYKVRANATAKISISDLRIKIDVPVADSDYQDSRYSEALSVLNKKMQDSIEQSVFAAIETPYNKVWTDIELKRQAEVQTLQFDFKVEGKDES